ncbi:MAG: sigma-54-dependent Fis family transcriptional regulator [Deltaproteobacteria bacterium]|nr:sigma-54-dependent Fis family transcriptional regulator [Deltaproteobacteria bacterium]
MENQPTILVVDDEFGVLQSFKMVLKDEFKVLLAATGTEALDIYNKNAIDLILLDILLPDSNGLDLLEKLKELDSNIEIIMITAVRDIQTAVKAIRLGAYDYIVKPFDVVEVLKIIRRALEKYDLVKKVIYLKNELGRLNVFEEMIGQDIKMKKIYDLISMYSQTDGTVLIQGESGTGKELAARAIHRRSLRKDQPFVVINCAAIPTTLMESEIFGYQKGAFTGAVTTVIGKLEIAQKGTVFLDDIDSLSTAMQSKLLRVIQEKEFEKIGSRKVVQLDVRFIATSNQDLLRLIEKGEFREDLFYRLNVLPLELPALRERISDITLLVNHFLEYYSKNTGKPTKEISQEALQLLLGYDWPGNVRELKNLIERLTTIIKNPVIRYQDVSMLSERKKIKIRGMRLKDAVGEFEKNFITEILEQLNYNVKEAAKVMDVHRNTLINKMKEYGLKS